MAVRQVTPAEAAALLAQGYAYLDVRSELEFNVGHVPGAFNVPLLEPLDDELVPNPDFVAHVEDCFARDSKLVVGCHSGQRSARAIAELNARGFGELVNLRTGWHGRRDAFGSLIPGWSLCGLPVEQGQTELSYSALRARFQRAMS